MNFSKSSGRTELTELKEVAPYRMRDICIKQEVAASVR